MENRNANGSEENFSAESKGEGEFNDQESDEETYF